MSENKKETKVRNKIVHIAFTEGEKTRIKEYADDSEMTVSEFIRQATRDKIRRIDNPEQSNISNLPVITPEMLLKISKNTEKLLELQQEKKREKDIIQTLLETSEALQSEYHRLMDKGLMSELTEETRTIQNLLRGHKSLSPNQIIDMTNIEKDKVLFVITNLKLFKLNVITGKYQLRGD